MKQKHRNDNLDGQVLESKEPAEPAASKSFVEVTNPVDSKSGFPEDYEIALQNLRSLIDDVQPENRNEATTRFHIIDRILFDCLGWEKSRVTLEEAHGNEYTDYVMRCPWPTVIVEAKKEGIYFDLPATKSGAVVRNLSPLLNANRELKAAAEQVAKYCQTRGVMNAVVTNGNQFIAFMGSRTDGSPPLEGKAVVFESLEHLLDNFLTAWNCLSAAAIAADRLASTLGQYEAAPPTKVSATIIDYPGYKQRNDLQADLEIVADLVFHDISESRVLERDFLEECYCKSGALSQHSSLTRAILEARHAQLFIDDQQKPAVKSAIGKKGEIAIDLIAEGLAKRPIVLIGDVGSGKTSFLRKMIAIDAPEILQDSITLYVDLGRSAMLEGSVRDYVLVDIPRQLRVDYHVDIDDRNIVRGIYALELKRFSKGIFQDLAEIDPVAYRLKEIEFLEQKIGNKSEHIKAALNHLSKGRKKTITLILDNCDQREEPDQQEAFLISEEIASTWNCVVFVTLRPETFNRSRRKGALTGYHPKVFTISPPRVDLMLDKRLAFAQKICSGEYKLEIISSHARFERLKLFIEVVRNSLRSNSVLFGIIDDISAGNMRTALDLLKEFISSGHINTQKILHIQETSARGYLIAPHEFLRAIIFQDHIYYDPQSSHVVNLFQQWTNDPKEIFLVPILISTAMEIGENGGGADGFVSYQTLVLSLQKCGFTPRQIAKACNFALHARLIQSVGRLIPEVSQDVFPGIRITSHGKYHLHSLLSTFVYLDAVMIDARLSDETLAAKIAQAGSLKSRIDAVSAFVLFIDRIWNEQIGGESEFGWPRCKANLEQDLSRVAAHVTA